MQRLIKDGVTPARKKKTKPCAKKPLHTTTAEPSATTKMAMLPQMFLERKHGLDTLLAIDTTPKAENAKGENEVEGAGPGYALKREDKDE